MRSLGYSPLTTSRSLEKKTRDFFLKDLKDGLIAIDE